MPGKKYKWSVADEDTLIDRYEAARYMYDMTDKDYMSGPKKTSFLNALSADLKIPIAQIEKRWRSFRTNHGRAMNPGKSGSAAKPVSKRKEQLQRRLAFINRHIKRRKTRSSLPDEDQESEEEEDVEDESQAVSDGEEEQAKEAEDEHTQIVEDLHTPEHSDNGEGEQQEEEEAGEGMSSKENSDGEGEQSHAESEEDGSHQDVASVDDVEEKADSDVVGEDEDITKVNESTQSPDNLDKNEEVSETEDVTEDTKDDKTNNVKSQEKEEDVASTSSDNKRKLEVWEEDLLPVKKVSKVTTDQKKQILNEKPSTSDRKDNDNKNNSGVKSDDITEEEPRSPTPPPPKSTEKVTSRPNTPTTDEKKVKGKGKKKTNEKKNVKDLDEGKKTQKPGGIASKTSQHKPNATKSKQALKTLKDFKALVGEDDVDEPTEPVKTIGIVRKPPPPLDPTAKKDKGGGKSTKKAQAKAAIPPKRLEMQIPPKTATKKKTPTKDVNEDRLVNLEKSSDRRLSVVEKMAESWSDLGKNIATRTSQSTSDTATTSKHVPGSDFTDEEKFWSGLLITRLRRIKDRHLKDDVMMRCEQIINEAIREKKKKDIAVGVDAAPTVAGPLITPSQPDENATSQRAVNRHISSSSSAPQPGGSAAGPMTSLLVTPPRQGQGLPQYTTMNTVASNNIPQNVQQQLTCSSNMIPNPYGHAMGSSNQAWIPGSPSVPQPQVYCHNYYGYTNPQSNPEGPGGHNQ